MRAPTIAVAALLMVLAQGCGVGPDRESYTGEPRATALLLTAQNHSYGFGQSNCVQCHVLRNIHVDTSAGAQVELARTLVEQSGLASCRGCHGANGISP